MEKLLTELAQLQKLSRALWWATVLSPLIGALIAVAVNSYRQWWIEPRISGIVAADQEARAAALEKARADQEVALRAEVAKADQRAAEAEARAAHAATAANTARERADRHLPVSMSPLSHELVARSLRTWAAVSNPTVDLVWVGAGTPAMDKVSAELLSLFKAAEIRLGKTMQIGMAVGLPHGALVFSPPELRTQGEGLIKALNPFLRNLDIRLEKNSRLTLHLNGTPSFDRDGGVSIE